MSQDEERHRADGWSLRQFRARGWSGAVLVALFGGIAAVVPYYSVLVLLMTVAATIATLLAWLLISLLGRRYTPPLSVHLSSLVFIFVALACCRFRWARTAQGPASVHGSSASPA